MSAVLRDDVSTAVVTPRRGVSSTEYLVSGTLESVLEAIRKMFEEYPAAGYGTYVHAICLGNNYSTYTARVSHSNSCE